jgi:hypothetical protein
VSVSVIEEQVEAPVHEPLLRRAKNVYSQTGEDGILEAIFQHISPTGSAPWAVEFGAWDGKKFSNTCNLLMHRGWHGVMIEANPSKHAELVQTYAGNAKVHCLNAWVTFDGAGSLDTLLAATRIPQDFDLLSIDIDGNDYHIWDSVKQYRAKVVVIEFNPSIPHNISFVQERNMLVRQGSSLLAIAELGKRKGYELVCVTELNAIFVRNDFFEAFGIRDNSLDTLHKDTQYITQVFQLYDGTLVWRGCREMLWHGVPIKPERMQVLPTHLRFLPDSDLPPEKRALLEAELPRLR